MRGQVWTFVAILALVVVSLAVWAIPSGVMDNPVKFKADDTQVDTSVDTISADTGYVITKAVFINEDTTQVLVIMPGGTAAFVSLTAGGNTGFTLLPGESITFECLAGSVTTDSDGTCDYRYFLSEAQK